MAYGRRAGVVAREARGAKLGCVEAGGLTDGAGPPQLGYFVIGVPGLA